MVGQGDEIHAAATGLFVDVGGGAEAFGAANGVEGGFAGFIAGAAVAMEIGAAGCSAPSGGAGQGHTGSGGLRGVGHTGSPGPRAYPFG